mgnify:CR=1 FL=1
MIKRFSYFLFGLYILFSQNALAQKKDFPSDPKMFIQELQKFFSEDKRQESQDAIKIFSEAWNKNAYTADEQAEIIAMANYMQQAKLRVNTDFTPYVDLLNAYKSKKISLDKLKNYHEVAKQLIDKSKKDLKDFTATANALFNDQALYKTDVKTWKISSDKYTFAFTNEAVVNLSGTDLQLLTREDTMGIYATAGKYFPASEKWIGTGGNVYWTRVGFAKDRAFAKLRNYNLNMKSSEYTADSVDFSFPKVFAKPILGKLQDKATTDFLGAKASYPRFKSYQAIFEIKNIFNNIDYKGGFTLEGNQILGTGVDSARAQITIKYNNKIALRALSNAFVINPDNIAASKAAVAVYLDKDSVFHSQLVFNYQEKTRRLSLSRDIQGLYAAPFYSTYHQLEFISGNLIWPIDEALVQFKTISNPDQASEFKSGSFFREAEYIQAQGLLSYHPLKKIAGFIVGQKSPIIPVEDLANYLNNKVEYINNLLFQLANQGYIFYDMEGKKIIVKDKLIHYVNAAESGADFDNIKFESVISARPNATISLLNNDFKLEGVPRIMISDSQSTYFQPTEQTVIIKKNRDMVFSGQVHSGRFDFYGKDFIFNYTQFNVILNNIDSVKFKFPEYDKNGKVIGMRTIQNSLQNVNGFLYIDKHSNKSGKQMLEDYPIFECNKESFVYYDRKSIFNGVYDRDNFYYKVNPFTIKNLDKFTAEGLRFPGSFTSADIIPEIKNDLTIQEDFSLGFIQESPAAGYNMYKGKGKGTGVFMLSNKGFRSKGTIDYLVSKTTSQEFMLFPDSMKSKSDEFNMPQIANGKYPPVLGKGIANLWKPYKDSMYVYKGKEPISVYNGKIDFNGSLILTPVELVGTGNMAYQNLNLTSTAFAFLPNNVKAKSSDLSIKGIETGGKAAVKADDINADIDLTKDFGKFAANVDTSKVQLPSNRFSTTLNRFTYDIGNKEVAFAKREKQSAEDAYFISENPEQAGLKFESQRASYKIEAQNITAQDVPHLRIADSRIQPANNEINIEKQGNIGTLKNAQIITSDEQQHHRIYNATINIFSKNKFTGFGEYDYVDRTNKKYRFTFNDVRTTETGKTVAKGVVTDTTNLYLSPGLRYSGNVNLESARKALVFDGYVLAENNNKQLRTEYIKINDTLDPANVVLNISSGKAKDGKDLFTGTFIASDSAHIYNLLNGRKKNFNDAPVFTASGSLYYDDKAAEFRVGPAAKVKPLEEGAMVEGNMFRYSPSKDIVNTEGVYDFGASLKHVEIATAGKYTYKYSDSSDMFDVVMMVDIPLNEEVAKLMADSIMENSAFANDVDNTPTSIPNAFAMLVKDKKQKEKIVNELSLNGFVPFNDAINKTFVFTRVQMSFNDTSNSFTSVGPLGLANTKKVAVNKQVGGLIEVRKGGRTGDRFYLLLESTPGSYHYFYYNDDILSYLSSDFTFTDKLAATAAKMEKTVKGGFRYKLATVREIGNLKKKGRKK